jgi:hypothetical protein
MIRDRRSNRMKSNYPPDRGEDARTTTTIGARPSAPKGKMQAAMTARRLDCYGLLPRAASTLACSVAQNAPLLHQQSIWPHSMSGFHAGDAAMIWGVVPQAFGLAWVDGEGAAGYTGPTLHATAYGQPTASLTLAGHTSKSVDVYTDIRLRCQAAPPRHSRFVCTSLRRAGSEDAGLIQQLSHLRVW